MTRATLAVLLCTGFAAAADPDPKSLAVPADTTARATDLVGSLASREYAVRVEATEELRKLGRFALPTLRDALAANSNPEIRLRIEMLLPTATADDLRARVECYLADGDGKYQHDLPGAGVYFTVAGRTTAAEKLFRDMMGSPNRDLIAALDDREADLNRRYLARRAELRLSATGSHTTGGADAPNATDLAALLLAESRLPDKPATTVRGVRTVSVFRNSLLQNRVKDALESDTRGDALAAVLTAWMETRDDYLTIYYAVSAMTRADSPLALPAARKQATGEVAGGSTTYRGRAIAYIGRFGTAADLRILEKLFDDRGPSGTVFLGGAPRKRTVIQVRDLALAMALLLTEQEPEDYGITNRYAATAKPTVTQKYMYSAYYFDAEDDDKADEKRDAALKKYAAWKAKQTTPKK
jgi:hypothetical protein